MVLEFVDGLKSQLSDMDEKLDALSSAVGAMHADLKRLVGRPVLDIYKDWSKRTLKLEGASLPSDGASKRLNYTSLIIHHLLFDSGPNVSCAAVYIEGEVVGPGAKQKFEVGDKDLYDPGKQNSKRPVTEAFEEFMMDSGANVLLLSGAAGSGKSTAYAKLQTWVLTTYAKNRKAHGIDVVLLPISLPQLKDPINGVFKVPTSPTRVIDHKLLLRKPFHLGVC